MANPAFAARPPVLTVAIQTEALPHAALSCRKHNPPAPKISPISLMNVELRARQRSRGDTRDYSAIQSWAKRQKVKPSRSEAIRRLIEFTLAVKAKDKPPTTNSHLHESRESSDGAQPLTERNVEVHRSKKAVAQVYGCESDNKEPLGRSRFSSEQFRAAITKLGRANGYFGKTNPKHFRYFRGLKKVAF